MFTNSALVLLEINVLMFCVYQREGPPPGQYKLSKDPILPKGPNVTSPFKSRTPRFVQPHVLVMCLVNNKYITSNILQSVLAFFTEHNFSQTCILYP